MDNLTKFFAIDLEMEQPSNEIISIGLAWNRYSQVDGYMVTRDMNFLITPSQPVSEFIQNLTGLNDSMFDWNKSREECFREFVQFLSEIDDLHREAVVWGCGDIALLLKALYDHDIKSNISRRFIDVKTLVFLNNLYSGRSLSTRTSLGSALSRYKIIPVGVAHNSAADAHNTLKLFNHIVSVETVIRNIIKEMSCLRL